MCHSPQTNSSLRPLLLAGYEDGSVTLWDVSERKVCSQITCHEEPVMGLDFDSQKAKGVSGSAGKVLAVWRLDDQQSLQVSAQAQASFILLCTNSLIGRNNI